MLFRSTAEALRRGGDKLEAKRAAAAAGIPVLPTGEPEEIGFPLMIKAAAGGGGRGMRVVREQLDLDVPGTLEVALEEDGPVAEGGLGFPARRDHGFLELARLANDSHPAAAAARRRLDHQREADLLRLAGRQHRNPGRRRGALRLELVPAAAQRFGSGADEDEPCGLDRLGEVGVLG